MASPLESAIAQIRSLDDLLLAAVAGQEPEVTAWMAQRKSCVERLILVGPTVAVLEELQDRTRRLEDRFLHWRRASIMELSLIDRHIRYLNEQRSGTAAIVPTRIDVSA
ncbi:MAG: hypothetical protein ACKV2U_01680 [Bryobacteraceae bacterium]